MMKVPLFYFSRASLSQIGSFETSNMWCFNLWIATFYVGGGVGALNLDRLLLFMFVGALNLDRLPLVHKPLSAYFYNVALFE